MSLANNISKPDSQFGPHNIMIKQDNLKYQYDEPEMPEVLFGLEKSHKKQSTISLNQHMRPILMHFVHVCQS